MSLLKAMGLPSQFGVTLLLFFFVLALAPYFAGKDFGVLKIPEFDKKNNRRLSTLAPFLLLGAILLHLPLLSAETQGILESEDKPPAGPLPIGYPQHDDPQHDDPPLPMLKNIRASGVGYPPDNIRESGRGYQLARRAAEIVAKRQLAERLKGVLLNSKTEVNMGKLRKDEIEASLNALVESAVPIEERLLDDGGVEVTIEMPSSAIDR